MITIKPLGLKIGLKTKKIQASLLKLNIDWTYTFIYILQEDESFILQEDGVSKIAQG